MTARTGQRPCPARRTVSAGSMPVPGTACGCGVVWLYLPGCRGDAFGEAACVPGRGSTVAASDCATMRLATNCCGCRGDGVCRSGSVAARKIPEYDASRDRHCPFTQSVKFKTQVSRQAELDRRRQLARERGAAIMAGGVRGNAPGRTRDSSPSHSPVATGPRSGSAGGALGEPPLPRRRSCTHPRSGSARCEHGVNIHWFCRRCRRVGVGCGVCQRAATR